MEVLLHNLSHSDMILGVSKINDKKTEEMNEEGLIIARPKFSRFHVISALLYAHVVKHREDVQIFTAHPYTRPKQIDAEPVIVAANVPVGFDLTGLSKLVRCDVEDLRFRQDDKEKLLSGASHASTAHERVHQCEIRFVYFPLFAISLRQWHIHTACLYEMIPSHHIERSIVLVSGRGKPNDAHAQEQDNSTEYTAKLLQEFVKHQSNECVYNKHTVYLLHSNTNLFRYDENILFVKRQLIPLVHELRTPIVGKYKEKWRENMRITLSFADGSSARVSAINQALKLYQ